MKGVTEQGVKIYSNIDKCGRKYTDRKEYLQDRIFS